MSAARAKKYSLVFVLWILFSLCCFAAPFAAIFFPLYRRRSYMRRFVKTADRMLAALLGFSGRVTLSVELASSDRYTWVRDILNMVEHKHCENEAFEEGAYCRIKDHEIGGR